MKHICHLISYFSYRKACFALSILLLFLLTQSSCKKLVDVDAPLSKVSQQNVYASDATAIAALTGIYNDMIKGNTFATGNLSISLLSGLSADEFTLYNAVSSASLNAYYKNALSASTGAGSEYWGVLYGYIFRTNAAIEGLNASELLTPSVKQQLVGEAKFMRAFFYYSLVNLFGDVPLILSTDWQINSHQARAQKSQVYQQIISDLKDAQGLLNDKFLDGSLQVYSTTADRVRPTKWAATALLARVYLFTNDWLDAEIQATSVIGNNVLFDTVSLNNVFKRNSKEAIWQLQPITSGQNTTDGVLFLMPSTGPSSTYPVYLSPQLLGAFEVNDQRRYNRNWVDSVIVNSTIYYFPYKYKLGKNSSITTLSQLTEYLMVLRLSEQYLIRAEARTQLGNNNSGAQSDLNIIRRRAGLPNTSANDKNSLLAAILHERQVELFSEWGHRWLDLKRTGKVDAVMTVVTPQKANGSAWQTYQQLYPLPFTEIQKAPSLTQNPGYQ